MAERITLWVPSKDRGLQLEALLSSIEKNAPNLFTLHVQFTHSNEAYKAGYDKLIDEYAQRYSFPQIWVQEQNLVEDLKSAVKGAKTSLFGICCDDCLYYRRQNTTVEDIEDVLDGRTVCFSARLGLNTIVQNYQTGELCVIPPHIEKVYLNGCTFLRWKYTQMGYHNNWGYPYGQDGHIFRTDFLLNLLQTTEFSSLRELESKLCLGRHKYHRLPYMASFEFSSVFSNPINSSQPGLYFDQEAHISLEELNQRFLEGERIDIGKMDLTEVRGCHSPRKLEFSI